MISPEGMRGKGIWGEKISYGALSAAIGLSKPD
jgi:hypothetical protein